MSSDLLRLFLPLVLPADTHNPKPCPSHRIVQDFISGYSFLSNSRAKASWKTIPIYLPAFRESSFDGVAAAGRLPGKIYSIVGRCRLISGRGLRTLTSPLPEARDRPPNPACFWNGLIVVL